MFAIRVRAVARVVGACAVAAAVVPTSPALAAPKPRLGARVLRPGMSGADVKTLQADLTKVGFKTPAVGVFGPITARNVSAFERRYHLTVNGIVNAAFVRQLLHVLAVPTNAPRGAATPAAADGAESTTGASAVPRSAGPKAALGSRTLKQGMSGSDVMTLQTDLTMLGIPTTVDGQYGPATKTSVIAFETAHQLTADGTFTAADATVLQQLVTAATAGGPPATATINPDGTATAPAGAPLVVQQVIAAANQIIDTPYQYGGGHGSFTSAGYDCSGAVSYALHGGGLLSTPEDSTELESYGLAGPGKWITTYADSGHAFVVIAGLAFDTAHFGPFTPSGTGPRWLQPADALANLGDGGDYIVRHPAGL